MAMVALHAWWFALMAHLGTDGADAALGQIHAERQTNRAAAHDEHRVSIWSAMEVLIAQFDAFAYALWKDGKNDSFRWAESEEEMPKGRAAADRRSSPLRDRYLSGGHSPHSGGCASAKTTVTIGAVANAGMMSINSFALTERLLAASRGPAMDRTAESREWVRV